MKSHVALVPQFKDSDFIFLFYALECIAVLFNYLNIVWTYSEVVGIVHKVHATLTLEQSFNYAFKAIAFKTSAFARV